MNKTYWRISYNGTGIYEALKKEIWDNNFSPKVEWKKLKNSSEFTWLKTPNIYYNNCYSYFTESGYKIFMEKTYPIIIKYLKKENIDVEKYNFNDKEIKIVYFDEHQIVVKK